MGAVSLEVYEIRMRLVSVIIPAYNEEAYIAALLSRIAAVDTAPLGFQMEIIVVNDGSKDRTEEIVGGFSASGVVCITQQNQGKGKAVQRGIEEARGEYLLVQDADLEYDPEDYPALLKALENADVVYGSRTLGQWQRRRSVTPGRHPRQGVGPWLAGVILTCWTFLLYGRWISDTLTAYKLYPAAALKGMRIVTRGFETDHEITARLIRAGLRIVEVPIVYHPRSAVEGKKIKPRDGFIAVWTLLRFRFAK